MKGTLRFKTVAGCLLALGCFAAISCSGSDKEDENASVVNVEKGVTAPMSTPDMTAVPEETHTVGIVDTEAESSGPEAEAQAAQQEEPNAFVAEDPAGE